MSAEVQEITAEESKESLMQQIHEKKEERNAIQEQEADEVHVQEYSRDREPMGEGGEEEEESDSEEKLQGFRYSLGDEQFDIDENAVFEIKADGKPVKMTLKEMRDAAAGGVAVRNRMRSLAEDRKKLYDPYKNFANIAETDPLVALKKIFSVIKQVEPKADVNKFLVGLGKQAQSLAQMSPSERKAYNLEKELDETRSNLTQSERIAKIQVMKQELSEEMGLNDEQITIFSQQILADPTLASSVKNEEDLFDRIGDLADEIQRQQAVITALHKFEPSLKKNNPLVFELSSLLEKNPDFDEDDLEEIAEGVLKGVKKSKAASVLSKRQRSNVVRGYKSDTNRPDYSRMSPKEALMAQLLAKKERSTKTKR